MNAKERIIVAMKNGIPDRVPVTLGLSESVPVRFFTDDYIDFFWKSKIPMWKARIETEYDRFGADGYLHMVEDFSPGDPVREKKNIKEKKDEIFYTELIHTKKGDLEADFYLARKSTTSNITHFIKDVEADIPKVLELLKHPDSKNIDEINFAYKEIGDRGHVGFWISVPIDWWSELRGTQKMLFDLFDHEELLLKVFKAYTEYAVTLVEYILKNTPLDSVGLGGSTTSMSVISPDLYRKFTLDFGKAVCKKTHEFNIPVQYHMCGKSRAALPITSEMGVDGFDALESPPTGTVDLAEVKKTFGHKHSLRGNVNSITIMKEGRPEDVEKDILRCMNSAKEGGGYILGVGDQTPYETSTENLFAFVEAGKKLGKY